MHILPILRNALMSLVGAVALAPVAEAQQNRFPPELVGSWMRLPEKNEPVCSIKDTDAFENAERLMRVTPREFFRYEMGCTPVKMMNSSPYFTMKMQCSGEGEKWTEEHQWMLVRMLDRDVLIQTSGRTNKRGIDLSSTVMEKCR